MSKDYCCRHGHRFTLEEATKYEFVCTFDGTAIRFDPLSESEQALPERPPAPPTRFGDDSDGFEASWAPSWERPLYAPSLDRPAPAAPAPAPERARTARRSKPQARTSETAASSAAARVVNTWFDSDHPPPFLVGQRYVFCLQIGPEREGAEKAKFAEPDFGNHASLDICVSLYSRDCELENSGGVLHLDRVGATDVLAVGLRPRRSGRCKLDIVLSLARELDVLQTLAVELEVAKPKVKARPTAPRARGG